MIQANATVQANATSTIPIASVANGSKLAAVAFNDTNNILQYRVYYQDSNNYIRESSWNASAKTWYVSNSMVTKAKPQSPIAASAIGLPEFSLPVSIQYPLPVPCFPPILNYLPKSANKSIHPRPLKLHQ